jgi:hypothetical protein
MVPQLALAAAHNAPPPPPPVVQATGFVGGFGSLHCECQCNSATHTASQVALLPYDVQQ